MDENKGTTHYWDRLEELAEVSLQLIMQATRFMKAPYPHACVSTLECDMLRVEWVTPKGEIRVIFPWLQHQNPYIYWQFGEDKYGVDKTVTPENLGFYLNLITPP